MVSEHTMEGQQKLNNIAEVFDRTQGHLILRWNAWRGAKKLEEIGLSLLYCIVALFFLVSFAIESLLQLKTTHAEILLSFAILTVLSYVYLRLTGNNRSTNTFLVILLGSLCIFLLVTGGIGGTGPLWFYVFPLFSLFVQRLWAGTVSVIVLFVLAALLLLIPNPAIPVDLYPEAFKERFLAVYVAVSVMAFFYAFLRASAEMELSNMNDYLRKSIDIDDLTGLPNRRRMRDIIYQEISRFRRSGRPFSMVMMDIDHFKSVNDRYGHACGDSVIQMVTKTIQDVLRTQDTCSRWGGEEFLLVLPETDKESAVKISERLRQKIQEISVEYNQEKISITMSFGVREFFIRDNFKDCLQEADKKLYEAKAAGRNRVMA